MRNSNMSKVQTDTKVAMGRPHGMAKGGVVLPPQEPQRKAKSMSQMPLPGSPNMGDTNEVA